MLTTLHIENVAVVKELDLEFTDGFNVLTGETGSGKSVIITSIGMLLGDQVSKDMIRSGEEEAMVSGYFTGISENNIRALADLGIAADSDGGLFVQRNVSASGRATSRIGGRIVPVSLQKEAVGLLCDIHGQQDNHKLLNEKNHLRLLDSYGECGSLLREYEKLYAELCDISSRLDAAQKLEEDKEQRSEYLKYRIDELEKAHLKPGEEDELEARCTLLKSAEKTAKNVNIIYRALYKNDKGASACSLIDMARRSLESISDVMPEASEYLDKLDTFSSEMQDIAEVSAMLTEDIGNDPSAQLDSAQSRLGLLSRLEKKYGTDHDGLMTLLEKSREELDELESSEMTVKELTQEKNRAFRKASEAAAGLRKKRSEAAETLEKLVVGQLGFLDMKSARFVCEFTETKLGPAGADNVRFLISTNSGEPPKSLVKTASGGELARIMLGIKSVFAEKEYTETLIYDEIDTGISGKTSQRLGMVLKNASESAQIICITHSAQIAAAAKTHFCVAKTQSGGRVQTGVRVLGYDARVEELARIMGGNKITPELLESAAQLIKETV